MLVQISVENAQPLTGSASAPGRQPVAFVGWLGLLRAIAELVGAPDDVVKPGREAGDEPATREPGAGATP